jgi:hypothetical protein
MKIVRDASKKQFKDERIIPHPTSQVKPYITQSLPKTKNMLPKSDTSDESDTSIEAFLCCDDPCYSTPHHHPLVPFPRPYLERTEM